MWLWGGSGLLTHFAHATGLCAGLYSPLVQKLTHTMRVIGMDDRGHGRTKAPADPKQLKHWQIFVDDLDHLFSSLPGPVVAMGHSRGAVISMLLAIRKPDLIKGLVLIDPTILPHIATWYVFLLKQTGLMKYIPIASKAAKRTALWPDRQTMLAAYQNRGMFQSWQDGFLEAYVRFGTETVDGVRIKLSCEPAWESKCFSTYPYDLWRYIPLIKHPVLILYGEQSDTFGTLAVKRFKKKVPQADIRCLPDTSHFVPMERPDETAEAIVSFVNQHF